MKTKKGISPLIATVLLIGFTVALAAVVITWGLDFIKGTTKDVESKTEEAMKCATQLDFKIESADCTAGTVTIQNNGGVDIAAITFRVFTGGDVVPIPEVGIGSLGIKQYTVDLTGASKIEAIASVQGAGGKVILCKDTVEEYALSC